MKDKLVSFETAKLAHEKGFRVEAIRDVNGCIYNFYDKTLYKVPYYHEHYSIEDYKKYENDNEDCYYAPTQSLLQKWLREVHKIFIGVEVYWDLTGPEDKFIYSVTIYKLDQYNSLEDIFTVSELPSYEEALEIGLTEALKTLQNEESSN